MSQPTSAADTRDAGAVYRHRGPLIVVAPVQYVARANAAHGRAVAILHFPFLLFPAAVIASDSTDVIALARRAILRLRALFSRMSHINHVKERHVSFSEVVEISCYVLWLLRTTPAKMCIGKE